MPKGMAASWARTRGARRGRVPPGCTAKGPVLMGFRLQAGRLLPAAVTGVKDFTSDASNGTARAYAAMRASGGFGSDRVPQKEASVETIRTSSSGTWLHAHRASRCDCDYRY